MTKKELRIKYKQLRQDISDEDLENKSLESSVIANELRLTKYEFTKDSIIF